jgi:thiamine-phosphate diphosphorylase/hydroxyethylthiazole kinase
MTNIVVANDSANATLALGGSPIMATHPRDVKDLSKILDALLINFGWAYAFPFLCDDERVRSS